MEGRNGGKRLALAVPKGRMQDGVARLLRAAGLEIGFGERDYRPDGSAYGLDVKLLKPQNIVEMLHAGTRDLGFAGADWVAELGADVVELMDTGLDPVSVVVAAPASALVDGRLRPGPLVIASEYAALARRWIDARGLDATLVRSYGATEVFPPEDADAVVDCVATGATLRANSLVVTEILMTSTTRLYASRRAMADPLARQGIERFRILCESVSRARSRVMVELSVGAEALGRVVDALPAAREAVVSPLSDGVSFAVRTAAPRSSLHELLPALVALGGTGIVVTEPSQIVP